MIGGGGIKKPGAFRVGPVRRLCGARSHPDGPPSGESQDPRPAVEGLGGGRSPWALRPPTRELVCGPVYNQLQLLRRRPPCGFGTAVQWYGRPVASI